MSEEKKNCKRNKKPKLDLEGLNVEALFMDTEKAAAEFGLMEERIAEEETKRVFRVESTFISR